MLNRKFIQDVKPSRPSTRQALILPNVWFDTPKFFYALYSNLDASSRFCTYQKNSIWDVRRVK